MSYTNTDIELLNDRIFDLESHLVRLQDSQTIQTNNVSVAKPKSKFSLSSIVLVASALVMLLGLNINIETDKYAIVYNSDGLLKISLSLATVLGGAYTIRKNELG